MSRKPRAIKHYRPKILIAVQVKLWVLAGGRCEFYGCNEPLWVDTLTFHETNYSNIAHIVAWSENGPRGDDSMPPSERNKIENLMLVCTKHHTLIDSKEYESLYPKELLCKHKRLHEDRIARLTAYHPLQSTTIIRFKANIKQEVVEVSQTHIREAIEPRHPADMRGIEIDLTRWPTGDGAAYWQMMADAITQKIALVYTPGIETDPVEHLSVFALGPIPLLVHLGSCLSNKIPVDLYQRHRDTEDWAWKQKGEPVKYKLDRLRVGSDPQKVALLLSLSGKIREDELPEEIRHEFSIYEITLDGMRPSTTFLRRQQDLHEFKDMYCNFLRDLRGHHGSLKEIHLFPAIPAPVAVVCGRERLHKIDPALLVYDCDKEKGGFKLTLKVN